MEIALDQESGDEVSQSLSLSAYLGVIALSVMWEDLFVFSSLLFFW